MTSLLLEIESKEDGKWIPSHYPSSSTLTSLIMIGGAHLTMNFCVFNFYVFYEKKKGPQRHSQYRLLFIMEDRTQTEQKKKKNLCVPTSVPLMYAQSTTIELNIFYKVIEFCKWPGPCPTIIQVQPNDHSHGFPAGSLEQVGLPSPDHALTFLSA